jgi:hypothetical protein
VEIAAATALVPSIVGDAGVWNFTQLEAAGESRKLWFEVSEGKEGRKKREKGITRMGLLAKPLGWVDSVGNKVGRLLADKTPSFPSHEHAPLLTQDPDEEQVPSFTLLSCLFGVCSVTLVARGDGFH